MTIRSHLWPLLKLDDYLESFVNIFEANAISKSAGKIASIQKPVNCEEYLAS